MHTIKMACPQCHPSMVTAPPTSDQIHAIDEYSSYFLSVFYLHRHNGISWDDALVMTQLVHCHNLNHFREEAQWVVSFNFVY